MVPKLTAEQRRAALDKGMQIRLKRAEYKARLKVAMFSWLVPLLATAMVIMTYIALAIVRGGNCE